MVLYGPSPTALAVFASHFVGWLHFSTIPDAMSDTGWLLVDEYVPVYLFVLVMEKNDYRDKYLFTDCVEVLILEVQCIITLNKSTGIYLASKTTRQMNTLEKHPEPFSIFE